MFVSTYHIITQHSESIMIKHNFQQFEWEVVQDAVNGNIESACTYRYENAHPINQ